MPPDDVLEHLADVLGLVARGDDRAEHRVDGVELCAPVTIGGGVADEDRLGRQDVADGSEAVHPERRTGRHEVHDRLGQTEPWRDLDGTGDRDDVHRDALAVEEPARCVGMGRGDAMPGEIADRSQVGIIGDCDGEPTSAIAEIADPWQLRSGLGKEVEPGDTEVSDAVADELDDVAGPNEEDVERVVLDPRDEAAVVLVEHESRVVEQAQRRFDEAALVGDGEAETGGHEVPPWQRTNVLTY